MGSTKHAVHLATVPKVALFGSVKMKIPPCYDTATLMVLLEHRHQRLNISCPILCQTTNSSRLKSFVNTLAYGYLVQYPSGCGVGFQ